MDHMMKLPLTRRSDQNIHQGWKWVFSTN